MTALCFSGNEGLCQVNLAEPNLPAVILKQLDQCDTTWFEVSGLDFDTEQSDIAKPWQIPLFFEWQRLDWLFEPADHHSCTPPFALFVNGIKESAITCKKLGDRYRLTGATHLRNAVGKTRFTIRDSKGKLVFELGVEVFPQKIDYKDDFYAMVEEITEIVYSLAFDAFKQTFVSAKDKTTYRQTLTEWLNLYRVLATSFEQSVDTIMRHPHHLLRHEQRVKSIDLVKKASPRAMQKAIARPSRYMRSGGYEVAPNISLSHLEEQHRQLTYDTFENRFVLWAIKQVVRKLATLITAMEANPASRNERLQQEIAELGKHQRRLLQRISAPIFADVGEFSQQQQFSTTLTMAAGYKEFYHRYLLLRKGLSLADNALFKMDLKDVATLYEYWCFLKTVKLLRDNPKYDLTKTDIIKLEHQRFSVNLKKGKESAVHFTQRSTGDEISLYYNREFGRKYHTHTFKQIPDNFIEFSRAGYNRPGDKKTFKVVLDAKYRFDKGSAEYPDSPEAFGPPLDTIAQLHRYRDSILWQQDSNDSIKVANKSIGGVILFPYPNDEKEFVRHPFFQSIEKVNIGAIPLQPGRERENILYKNYLDSLFEQSGDVLNESRIRYDSRTYDAKRQSQRDLVMVGLVPSNNRDARIKYHADACCFYTQWAKEPMFPLERVKTIALYDQQTKRIYAVAHVDSVEFLMGHEIASTGTTWPARKPLNKHCLYRLDTLRPVDLTAGAQMSKHRNGRFFVSRLGLDLALEYNDSDLLWIHSWDQYREWKSLLSKYEKVNITRHASANEHGQDVSELIFSPVLNQE
ncbi:MAG: putative component of viral defense system (DUF524 family) [Pseudohongiellaceae bacterium]|jgi:predicted component of viral defense system (DUF524 family)